MYTWRLCLVRGSAGLAVSVEAEDNTDDGGMGEFPSSDHINSWQAGNCRDPNTALSRDGFTVTVEPKRPQATVAFPLTITVTDTKDDGFYHESYSIRLSGGTAPTKELKGTMPGEGNSFTVSW